MHKFSSWKVRIEQQERVVIEKFTTALGEAVGTPIANVCVWIHAVPKENWHWGVRKTWGGYFEINRAVARVANA